MAFFCHAHLSDLAAVVKKMRDGIVSRQRTSWPFGIEHLSDRMIEYKTKLLITSFERRLSCSVESRLSMALLH
jgi:hypothetical protein